MARLSVVLTVVGLACAACADSPASNTAYVARDSSGTEVVSNDPSCTATNTWALEPRLTIGTSDGETAFGRIAAMTMAPGGELYVLDDLEKRILVFGPDGAFLRRFGGPGEGPGEFRYPNYVGLLGPDRIAVGDGAPSRLHVLTGEGDFVRQIRIEPPEDGAGSGLANVVAEWAVTPRGDVWAALRMYSGAERDSTPVRLVRFDGSGEVADTVLRWQYPGSNHSFEIYKSRWQWAIGADGTIVTSPGHSHEVRFLRPDGSQLVARRDTVAMEVTPAIRNSALESYFAYMKGEGELSEMIRQAREHAQVPSVWPAIMDIFVSSPSNRVWARSIRPAGEDAAAWEVAYHIYAPSGQYLGCVPAPPHFRPRIVTDSVVWGSYRDELDVAFVRTYSVVPPTSSAQPGMMSNKR